MKPTDQDRLNLLRREITDHLDESSIRQICTELDIDYDDLPGRGQIGKVWGLLEYVKEKKKIPLLLHLLREKNPLVIWDDVLRRQSVESATEKKSRSESLLKNPVVIGALITATLGLLGAIVTGYFNLRATDRPIQATQTAENKLTMATAEWTSTPVSKSSPTKISASPTATVISNTPTWTPEIEIPLPTKTQTHTGQQPAVTIVGVTNTPTPSATPLPEYPVESGKIDYASTGTFFDGELTIAVYYASWGDKKTTFGVSVPGFPEDVVYDQVVGARVFYTQNGRYEVTVTGFPNYSDAAEFTVTRLQEPAQAIPDHETLRICEDDSGTAFNRAITIAVIKSPWGENLVSFDIFSPGGSTLRIENEMIGRKFSYQENGSYEIQTMSKPSYTNCVNFTVWKLP